MTSTSIVADGPVIQSLIAQSKSGLVSINDSRLMLHHNIKNKLEEINSLQSQYWAQQTTFMEVFKRIDSKSDQKQWEIDFATEQMKLLSACHKKQGAVRSEIDEMVQKARELDNKFREVWHTTLHQVKLAASANNDPARAGTSSPEASSSQLVDSAAFSQQQPAQQQQSQQGEEQPHAQTSVASKTKPTRPSLEIPSPASEPRSTPYATRAAAKVVGAKVAAALSASKASKALDSFPQPKSSSEQETSAGSGQQRNKQQRHTLKTPSKPAVAYKTSSSTTQTQNKQTSAKSSQPPSNSSPVTNPEPGELYQVYYKSSSAAERGWYMGTVLPWMSKDWADKLMLNLDMSDIDLESGGGMPACYKPIHRDGALVGVDKWEPGFEDGGPHVQDRSFIFLYFEDTPGKLGCLNIDTDKPSEMISFPDLSTIEENMPIDWVSAKNLRAFDSIHQDKRVFVRGTETAEKFRRKMSAAAVRKYAGITSQDRQVVRSRAGTGEAEENKDKDKPAKYSKPSIQGGIVEPKKQGSVSSSASLTSNDSVPLATSSNSSSQDEPVGREEQGKIDSLTISVPNIDQRHSLDTDQVPATTERPAKRAHNIAELGYAEDSDLLPQKVPRVDAYEGEKEVAAAAAHRTLSASRSVGAHDDEGSGRPPFKLSRLEDYYAPDSDHSYGPIPRYQAPSLDHIETGHYDSQPRPSSSSASAFSDTTDTSACGNVGGTDSFMRQTQGKGSGLSIVTRESAETPFLTPDLTPSWPSIPQAMAHQFHHQNQMPDQGQMHDHSQTPRESQIYDQAHMPHQQPTQQPVQKRRQKPIRYIIGNP